MTKGVNLEEVVRLHGTKKLELFYRIHHPENYEVFKGTLEEQLALVVRDLAEMKRDVADLPEAGISNIAVMLLRKLGYQASAETNSGGGHVDLTVEILGQDRVFKWLGEAKIDRESPAYIEGGLQQLLTRYSTGLDPDGGIVVYVRTPDALKRLTAWQKYLAADKPNALKQIDPDIVDLRFRSVHTHVATGTDYTVLHIGVPLYYKPEK